MCWLFGVLGLFGDVCVYRCSFFVVRCLWFVGCCVIVKVRYSVFVVCLSVCLLLFG